MYIETQTDESTPATWPETADAELVWAEPGFRLYRRPGGFFVAVGGPQRAPSAEATSAAIEEILDAVIDAGDQEILAQEGDRDLKHQLMVDAVLRYRQRRREALTRPDPPRSPFPEGERRREGGR